jgi:hypothetical protein
MSSNFEADLSTTVAQEIENQPIAAKRKETLDRRDAHRNNLVKCWWCQSCFKSQGFLYFSKRSFTNF